MTEFNNSKTTLDDVHVGDHVAFLSNYEKYWTTVTSETKTLLGIGDGRYMRRSGYRHGSGGRWHRDRIEPLGGGGETTYADLIRDGVVERAEENRRNKALLIIDAIRWRKLTTATLEQIAAIVEAEKAKEK